MSLMKRILISAFCASVASIGFAYNFDDLSMIGKQNQVHVGPAFMTSKTEYEMKKGAYKYDVDRKMIGVSASSTVGEETAVFGQFGRVMDSEISADNIS